MFVKLSYVLVLLIIFTLFSFYIYFGLYSVERSTEVNTNEVLVPTSVGAFVGNLVTFGDKSVSVFLGIPYAKPPLGSLRFKPPVPLTESTHRVSANRWPNPCLQKDNHLVLNNYNFSVKH